MYWKNSFKTNGIRQILLFAAGWKDPKGYMKKNKKQETISYDDSHTIANKENDGTLERLVYCWGLGALQKKNDEGK